LEKSKGKLVAAGFMPASKPQSKNYPAGI